MEGYSVVRMERVEDPQRVIVDTWLDTLGRVKSGELEAFVFDLSADLGQEPGTTCYYIKPDTADLFDHAIRNTFGEVYSDLLEDGATNA